MRIIVTIFGTITNLLILYAYCYYGKLATDYYAQYAERLCYSKWMNLPTNIQKYFIMMIAYAQEPMFYHGYGIVELNLNTYTKVRS